MAITLRNLKHIVAALAAAAAANGLPAQADEAALLEQLRVSEGAAAQRIEREILLEWSRSGSAAMDLLLRRGRDAMEEGDPAAAFDHFAALTDHAPDFAEGWHGRAAANFELGRYGAALLDLEQVLALNPNQFEAVYGLGVVLEQLGRPEEALRAFRMLSAIHPAYKDLAGALKRLQLQVEGIDI